jgi:hypothetical protein
MGTYPVQVAGHTVTYDAERDLYFADVRIDPHQDYWPFIRLALCRYQPNSISRCELSHVVIADFAQLAPTRTAQVVYGTDPAQVTLSVSGTTYSKSSMGATESKFVASDREHLTVTLEHADPGASDDPRTWVAVSDYPPVDLKRNLTYKTTGMWSVALQVPALRREGEYRLAIREYERFDQTTAVGTTTNYAMADRLVYAETMPLKATGLLM